MPHLILPLENNTVYDLILVCDNYQNADSQIVHDYYIFDTSVFQCIINANNTFRPILTTLIVGDLTKFQHSIQETTMQLSIIPVPPVPPVP